MEMQLKAGEISVRYENGFLRYINYGNAEVLRMIYFALRDGNWGTLDAVISNEHIVSGDRSFTIHYDCKHRYQNTDICEWKVSITGKENGEIAYGISGQYLVDFKKNRTGLCVLHPADGEQAQEIIIIHTDGSYEHTFLPQFIAPQDLFKQIRSLRVKKDEHWYRVDFEGDIFETEDQRNWTDASFKTFCTPLDLPFPVSVKAGDKVHQKVTFVPETVLPGLNKDASDTLIITFSDYLRAMPEIGVGKSTTIDHILSVESVDLLKKLQLQHYQTDVDMTIPHWANVFEVDVANARYLHLPLTVSLVLSDDFEKDYDDFIRFCTKYQVNLHAVLLLSAGKLVTSSGVAASAAAFSKQLMDVDTGIGSHYNFTEINRHCLTPVDGQFISYAIHPQEHAFDDLTMVENIAGQAATVKTVKHAFGESVPVHITPLTLRRRFNPYANDPAAKLWSSEQRADPRQKNALGALFLLGSLKGLSISGAKSVTCFQTIGDEGLITADLKAFPVYDALRALVQIGSKQIVDTRSSHPLMVDCMLFDNGNMLVWNYTNEEQRVQFPGHRLISLQPQQILSLPSGFAQYL
ncbi:hypothetical protein MTO98_08100 [Mucilaginibacter sp. SMC90]|uniref:hypothetical protein n=1 Tax=Mucilaginibacter sp. SMC90 TaxID=2929803 RepID=UPI001FB42ED3|nr:hypothetical protein [Mucilaginibacter sp. SMC90]UOE51036.1 hypothetical protein MTO98_08100 [Mucilaginibacter sp. SMC90]